MNDNIDYSRNQHNKWKLWTLFHAWMKQHREIRVLIIYSIQINMRTANFQANPYVKIWKQLFVFEKSIPANILHNTPLTVTYVKTVGVKEVKIILENSL